MKSAAYITDVRNYTAEVYAQTATPVELCSITYLPLEPTSVRLSCGHAFNYEPLMSNIIMQNSNKYSNRLKKRCVIECPYCRTIHTGGMLPFYDVNFGTIPYMYGVHSTSIEEVERYTDKAFIKAQLANQKEIARARVAEEKQASKRAAARNKKPKAEKLKKGAPDPAPAPGLEDKNII